MNAAGEIAGKQSSVDLQAGGLLASSKKFRCKFLSFPRRSVGTIKMKEKNYDYLVLEIIERRIDSEYFRCNCEKVCTSVRTQKQQNLVVNEAKKLAYKNL
jgi:hypothetical protein